VEIVKLYLQRIVYVVAALLVFVVSAGAQTNGLPPMRGDNAAEWHESARSDRYTGGRIERGELVAGDPNIWITIEVPSFRLTLWQSGREVKTYAIGVGMKDFPIVIGRREAREVIWNPAWIPPASNWVREMPGVRPGQVIKPTDKRNPLGKLKIPLGLGYLIHQAKGTNDLGNLVSHGCVRMLKSDLFDLAEKIATARALPITQRQIERAKRSSKTLYAKLDPPLPVDINYDTEVVEGGVLYLYPDVYGRKTATVERVRAELEAARADTSNLDDATIRQMLKRVTRKTRFAVDVRSVEDGRALSDGRSLPLIGQPPSKKTAVRKRGAAGAGR
jgi:lipoprotein-anchoring transpeptidase ErfK/SrfK